MEDNEIIKALECCNDNYSCPADCPLYEDDRDCLLALNKPVLDLINRQKAEIERLKVENKDLSEQFRILDVECERLEKANEKQKAEIEHLKSATNFYRAYEEEQKAEVVKEFAERLKNLKHECGCNYRKKPVFAVTEDKIDNLVKEMVGESNA